MKSSDVFWNVIGNFNENTFIIQCIIFILIISSVFISYKTKYKYFIKLILSISNLFIGIVFFYIFDKSTIAYVFSGPLFLVTGLLFILSIINNINDKPIKMNVLHVITLILVLSYPLVSYFLGHKYPNIVLYILPCPLISISIVLYSLYKKRNRLLEIVMILWAITGLPKAFIFNVYEDFILFIIGCYGIYCIFNDSKIKSRLST